MKTTVAVRYSRPEASVVLNPIPTTLLALRDRPSTDTTRRSSPEAPAGISSTTSERARRLGTLALLALATAFAARPASVAGEKADEVVALYPSFLTWDGQASAWLGEIRGRIYRKEEGVAARLSRAALRGALGAVADRTTDEEERIFRDRTGEFAVDATHGKRVVIEVVGRSFVSERSRADGRFVARIRLPEGTSGDAVAFRATVEPDGARPFAGTLRLLGPTGVSVISDLDDTVKESNVLDRSELIANTFYRPYRATPGMPALYAAWAEQGAAVHYVTACPWQLFSPISDFLNESGFPVSDIEMRELRLANASFVNLFRDSRDFKKRSIREILRRFPARRFVLVGDSGQNDPEVYASIAREYRDRVKAIVIRAVAPEDLDRSRYEAAFEGMDGASWVIFADASTLPRDLEGWLRSLERDP